MAGGRAYEYQATYIYIYIQGFHPESDVWTVLAAFQPERARILALYYITLWATLFAKGTFETGGPLFWRGKCRLALVLMIEYNLEIQNTANSKTPCAKS